MSKIIRARARDTSMRLARDEAPSVKTEVTRYRGAQYSAEREGSDLVIYITEPGLDPGQVRDRARTGDASFIERLNAKNREFWARANGGAR